MAKARAASGDPPERATKPAATGALLRPERDERTAGLGGERPRLLPTPRVPSEFDLF